MNIGNWTIKAAKHIQLLIHTGRSEVVAFDGGDILAAVMLNKGSLIIKTFKGFVRVDEFKREVHIYPDCEDLDEHL